mgnify:CR=1 FL=1
MTSSHPLWAAPFRGRKPVDVTVTIPGSKSVTNRALILAAQATSPSIIRKPLISRDSELMSAGLIAMGVTIENGNDARGDFWKVTPATVTVSPKGTTAEVIKAVSIDKHGPAINNHLLEFAGIKSSFMNIFTASAKGCKIPKGPARSGPIRSCIKAAIFRSKYVE